MVDGGYGEPFERFDPTSGLPLPEPEDDELAAVLREIIREGD